MHPLRGTTWGPRPLPELLNKQLADHGFGPADAAICARLINGDPGRAATASLFVDLGACNFLAGDIDGAVASWRHALTTEHDAAACRAMLNLGLLYEQLHLHDRALSVLSSVSDRAVAPYASAAVMAAARCHQATGGEELAMESMARLAQSIMAHGSDTEELAEVLYGLGDLAAAAGRPDRAERAWRAASAAPTSASQQAATNRLVDLLDGQGRDEEVIDLLAPANDATLARAEALFRLGSTEQAAELAVSIDGATLAASDRFQLAALRRNAGRVNESIDELEALLNAADNEVRLRAAFNLGDIYADHSMVDAATTMYKTIITDGDRFWAPKAALALGDLCAGQLDHDQARRYWSDASESPFSVLSQAAQLRLAAESTEPIVADSVVEESAVEESAVEDLAVDEPVEIVEVEQLVDVVAQPPEPVADPQVIVLSALPEERDEAAAMSLPTASAFRSLSDSNPYAALAPEGHANDVPATTRNPYAELAPNFGDDDFDPSLDLEPGDWESMLEEWPDVAEAKAPAKPKKRSSAFSRYT